ncbi:MAG: hypothetical protein ACI4UL_08915, partial [Muribaculaceae bacterium]
MKKEYAMTFDKILDNNTLWAVRYDDAKDNALNMLFQQWNDPEWLVNFFCLIYQISHHISEFQMLIKRFMTQSTIVIGYN